MAASVIYTRMVTAAARQLSWCQGGSSHASLNAAAKVSERAVIPGREGRVSCKRHTAPRRPEGDRVPPCLASPPCFAAKEHTWRATVAPAILPTLILSSSSVWPLCWLILAPLRGLERRVDTDESREGWPEWCWGSCQGKFKL